MKRFDLSKMSDLLDEHIEKGEKLERRDLMMKSSKIELYEETISKGLSFDPFHPVEMVEDSPYYNPYAQHPMGGFYPHPSESWVQQGDPLVHGARAGTRVASGYGTVNEFYRVAGEDPMDLAARRQVIASTSRFANFRRSFMDTIDLQKAGMPIGSVSTYSDGQTYKKVAEGKWVPSQSGDAKKTQEGLSNKDPNTRAQAQHGIESHAGRQQKVQDLIKQRKREEEIIGRAKNEAVQAAASHTKNMMGKMYDGPMPKEYDQAHEEHVKQYGYEKKDPRGMMKQVGESLKPKTHNVNVHFTHQGKNFTHKFEGVHADHHQQAIERVTKILNQKLPGAVLNRVQAETPKEQRSTSESKPREREADAK